MSRSKQEIADISASHASAREGVEHAIRLMKKALSKERYVIQTSETKAYLEMRRDIPYFIHETEIQGTQILVNRKLQATRK